MPLQAVGRDSIARLMDEHCHVRNCLSCGLETDDVAFAYPVGNQLIAASGYWGLTASGHNRVRLQCGLVRPESVAYGVPGLRIPYCERCSQEEACANCSAIWDSHSEGFGGESYCSVCFSAVAEDAPLCPYCENCYPEADAYYSEITDRLYCSEDCCSSDEEYRQESVAHDNPIRWTFHGPGTQKRNGGPLDLTRRYYGVEIEVERNDSTMRTPTVAARVRSAMATDTVHVKSDGSLREGLEFVFHPRTLDSWRDALATGNGAVTAMLDDLRQIGYRSYQTSTCGLHVHINKGAFTGPLHLWKFYELFRHWPRELLRLSRRRDITAIERWAGFPAPFQGAAACRESYKVGMGSGIFGRYSAVNLTNSRTVEIRIFRGTLIAGSVLRAIELVDALITFSAMIPASDTATPFAQFRQWISGQRKTYPNLYGFLLDSPTEELAAS